MGRPHKCHSYVQVYACLGRCLSQAEQGLLQQPPPLAKPVTLSPQAMPGQTLVENLKELACFERVNRLLEQIQALSAESSASDQWIAADDKLTIALPQTIEAIDDLVCLISKKDLSFAECDRRQKLLQKKGELCLILEDGGL